MVVPDLPAWFFNHRVKDAARVQILAGQVSIRTRTPKDKQPSSQPDPTEPFYEIDPCIYHRFVDHVLGAGWDAPGQSQPPRLVHNGLLLRLPDEMNTGDDFIISVAANLAGHFQARLLVLDYQDLQDLVEHVVRSPDSPMHEAKDDYLAAYFPKTGSSTLDNVDVSSETSFETYHDSDPAPTNVPCPDSEGPTGGLQLDPTDLFRSVLNYGGEGPAVVVLLRSREFGRYWHGVCQGFQAAISTSGLEERVLVIATDNCSDTYNEHGPSWSELGTRPAPNRVDIFPNRTPSQESLFKTARAANWQERNKRALQRAIRRVHHDPKHALLQPYAEWAIPENSLARNLYKRRINFSRHEAQRLAARMMGSFPVSVEALVSLLEHRVREDEAKEHWEEPLFPQGPFLGPWPELNPNHQAAEHDEGNDEDELPAFPFPAGFPFPGGPGGAGINVFETLVDKSVLNVDWAHIEVDPVIKTHVRRLIALLERRGQLSGILRRAAGGALIYGPPGTGKTHLARVIAKETASTMIRVSPADINSMWHGVSENNIKDLFKFARERFPAIVFFDDADGLLCRRVEHDPAHRRDILNNFLNEVGGFENDPKSPLLILATNFPDMLDPAVLRRVPNRIFIDLPTWRARMNIFGICLREENLDSDVDLNSLAARTPGFTGSDIEFVCQQAAFSALEDITLAPASSEQEPIYLKMSHFNSALELASPSSDISMMDRFENFASSFDRPALNRMKRASEIEAQRSTDREEKPAVPAKSTAPVKSTTVALIESFLGELDQAKDGGGEKLNVPSPQDPLVDVSS